MLLIVVLLQTKNIFVFSLSLSLSLSTYIYLIKSELQKDENFESLPRSLPNVYLHITLQNSHCVWIVLEIHILNGNKAKASNLDINIHIFIFCGY